MGADLVGWLRDHNPEDRPALVVAGSLHHRDAAGVLWNRCLVLDGQGRTLWTHDKCMEYSTVSPAGRQGYEDIRRGDRLRLFDGALGRMGALICLDFCGEVLLAPLLATRPGMLLIPAMTESMDPFRERARFMGSRARTASFVANNPWSLRGRPDEDCAHAYLPGKHAARSWTVD